MHIKYRFFFLSKVMLYSFSLHILRLHTAKDLSTSMSTCGYYSIPQFSGRKSMNLYSSENLLYFDFILIFSEFHQFRLKS